MARIKILDKNGRVRFIQDDDDLQPVEVLENLSLEEEDIEENTEEEKANGKVN